MRTRLSTANPFGPNRFGFAFEALRDGALRRRHLDYGCFDGSFIVRVAKAIDGDVSLVGVDVNEEALRSLVRQAGELSCARISDRGSLPFKDEAFDSISCMEVLEHVSATRRREILHEFWRLLRPGGILIVSVPERHLFSLLDLGNVKFRVPRLHRLFVQLRHGRSHYEQRYRNNRFRLIGDISVDAGWHKHFAPEELSALLAETGFVVLDVDGAGLFTLPLVLVSTLAPIRPVSDAVHHLQLKDSERFERANLFIRCRKDLRADQ